MKKLKKLLLLALLCLLFPQAFAQKKSLFSPQFSYNYENKMKIVWPVSQNIWTAKPELGRLESTQKYIPNLLGSINKISPELENLGTIDLTFLVGENFSKIIVNHNNKGTTYIFRDSLLEFTGKHKIEIIDKNQHPIFIYFNDLEALKEIQNIQFAKISEFIKEDVKPLKAKELPKIKEVSFISNDGKISSYGKIKREVHRTLGGQPMIGGMYFQGNLGIGLLAQISLLKHAEGNDDISHLQKKTSLSYKQVIFKPSTIQEADAYLSLGFEQLMNLGISKRSPIDMIGTGIGLYGLLNNDYTNEEDFGAYLSIIAETNKLYLSYDMNISRGFTAQYGLTAAYKF